MVKVTIAITTYNRKPMLRRCLESLFKEISHGGDIHPTVNEVILLDLGCSDGSCGMVELYFPQVRIVHAPEIGRNRAAARNRCVRESNTQWVIVSEDDVLFRMGWFEKWMGEIEPIPKVIHPSGFCVFMLNKTLFNEVGGFDENLVDGRYDDFDFLNRIEGSGRSVSKSLAHPEESFITHVYDWGVPSRLPSPRSAEYYIKKYGRLPV